MCLHLPRPGSLWSRFPAAQYPLCGGEEGPLQLITPPPPAGVSTGDGEHGLKAFWGSLGSFFLLSFLQNLTCRNISTLHQSRPHPPLLAATLSTFYHNHTCARLGEKLSREDELEQRSLLDYIDWPGPPPRSRPPTLPYSSDPTHSRFTILSKGGKKWYVDDQLEVLVQMQDFRGRRKQYGGDFLLARLHSPELGAGVAGRVLDLQNGFYSVSFPLLWSGPAQVEVTLVHSSEAVAVLQRLRKERSDRVFFQSLFRLGSLSETTLCNMCLPRDEYPLCNYTDLHTGEPWYCYKPKILGCDTRVNHAKGGFLKRLISNKESLLFQRCVSSTPLPWCLALQCSNCKKT